MSKVADPKPKIELTDTQLEFLQTYARLEEELGRGPSIREMAAAMGVYSDHSGAQRMMNKLRDIGVIRLKYVIQGGLTDDGAKLLGKKPRKRRACCAPESSVSRRNTRL